MVKKVLPPLNEQNQVPNIASSGEWKAEDATFLEKLANIYSSLLEGDGSLRPFNLSSEPRTI